jgi:hypothetical protein
MRLRFGTWANTRVDLHVYCPLLYDFNRKSYRSTNSAKNREYKIARSIQQIIYFMHMTGRTEFNAKITTVKYEYDYSSSTWAIDGSA